MPRPLYLVALAALLGGCSTPDTYYRPEYDRKILALETRVAQLARFRDEAEEQVREHQATIDGMSDDALILRSQIATMNDAMIESQAQQAMAQKRLADWFTGGAFVAALGAVGVGGTIGYRKLRHKGGD